jgi:hypothetical protein
MRKIMSIIVPIILASFVSTGFYAGAEEQKMEDKGYNESAKPMNESYDETAEPKAFTNTSGWIGKEVKTQQGEKVGTVEDIIRDNEGNISLAVISHGGFLGVGGENVAIPYSLLTFNEKEGYFVADLTEDQLVDAPLVEDEAKVNDRGFTEEVYRYFGERPYWTE